MVVVVVMVEAVGLPGWFVGRFWVIGGAVVVVEVDDGVKVVMDSALKEEREGRDGYRIRLLEGKKRNCRTILTFAAISGRVEDDHGVLSCGASSKIDIHFAIVTFFDYD